MVTKQRRGDVIAASGWAEQRSKAQPLFSSWSSYKTNAGTVIVPKSLFFRGQTAFLRGSCSNYRFNSVNLNSNLVLARCVCLTPWLKSLFFLFFLVVNFLQSVPRKQIFFHICPTWSQLPTNINSDDGLFTISLSFCSAYTVLKFMMMWTLVLLADFILEFRLEYLWPCWLFFGSVYTTFHCHGLVRTPIVISYLMHMAQLMMIIP